MLKVEGPPADVVMGHDDLVVNVVLDPDSFAASSSAAAVMRPLDR